MSVKVFITIDTEEDSWGQYTTSGSVDNIERLPALQALFNKYGAIPTYLVNYPVATTTSSIKILSSFLEKGECEIGTHCHPWNTPPYTEELGRRNSMMCNLPYELLFEKMSNLREVTESNFGVPPVSFRAGRWGFNDDVARCLTTLGYKIDTSISPFIDWTRSLGPNFRHASTHPYYFSPENIFESKGDGPLLEIPPTIGFYQSNFRFCEALQHSLKKPVVSHLGLLGILDRLKLLNFHWLSPELSNSHEMITLAERFVKSGHQFLNMSFHSTSMLPGKSPFVQDENDLHTFLNRIETFLQYAIKNGFEFLPLAESVKHIA
ncbi:glycosyl transferase, group 1 [hydrothermal vent metagenome]|uniref:Glycosyl transferase, group 1 n=1 Tax=hydrothermal vent metagenome TaxID=652676 RepID=A0A3B1AD51_9ZZZZ